MMRPKDQAEEKIIDQEDLETDGFDDETVSEGGNCPLDQEEEEKPETKDEELQTKYLRLAADFQNYKRRIEKEKSDIYAFANEKLMVELLNVIDNFHRALAVDSIDTGMKDGMAMIFKQLVDVMEKSGLEEIKALGEEFDPNCHHAVQMEASDSHKNGHVSQVLQKGYKLNNKVIRPSMVIVAE